MNSSDFSNVTMFVDDDNVSDFSHCPDYDKSGDLLLDNLGFYLEGILQVSESITLNWSLNSGAGLCNVV